MEPPKQEIHNKVLLEKNHSNKDTSSSTTPEIE